MGTYLSSGIARPRAGRVGDSAERLASSDMAEVQVHAEQDQLPEQDDEADDPMALMSAGWAKEWCVEATITPTTR